MNVLGSLATIALIAGVAGGCATPTAEDDAPEDAPAEDQPLAISVDSLDIVHGALRVSATMVDGAADVSVRLGGDCAHREVGGGVSTLSTLVWSLGDNDVAEAIGCGLRIRVRFREGVRYVNKVAELEVAVGVAASESGNADDGPQLRSVAASASCVGVAFAQVPRSARLTTGDSILEATPPRSEDEAPASDDTGQFSIPRIDFARCVLKRRPLSLYGSSFATTLSVGGTALEAEPQSSEVQVEEPEEEATAEPDDPPE